jgi:sn-glycerol 3-phosphate transport system substrate-binding protein
MTSSHNASFSRRRFLSGLAAVGGVAAAGLLVQARGGAPAAAPTAAPAAVPTQAPAPTQAAAATPTTAAAQAAPAAAGALKISFWSSFSGVNGQAQQELVNRFAKSQDKIALDYQFQGSYAETAQKLSAALAAKQAPDSTVLSDVWWQKFWLGKLIAPANPFMKDAGVAPTDFVDSFINEGSRNGNVFWIPFARSTPLFYYNADLYKAAGLDGAPQTWDDFGTNAEKLVKRDGSSLKVAALTLPPDASTIAWIFQPMVWEWGGLLSDDQYNITIDQPPAIAAGQFVSDLVNKQKVVSVPKDPVVDFTNGIAASLLQSTATLGTIEKNAKFTVGTAFLPTEKQFGCCTGGSGLTILSGSSQEKQAAAFTWINFATSDDQTTYWSQTTGYMPVRKKAIAGDQMAAFYKQRPNFQTAVKQLEKTKGQDWARVGIPNGDNIIGTGVNRITTNNDDPATALKDTAATLRKEGAPILAQLKAIGG